VITTAPLPLWPDLIRAARARPTDAVVIAPWLKPWDSGRLVPRSAWSLAALAKAVEARHGLPARVLLPGWICNQSLWPLRQTGAELIFLPVRPDGGMDWSAAGSLGTLDMVVVVHTFGHPAELDFARDFANSRGALLVEDCAHCLMPTPGLHESGDVVLYSPHKLLAVPEGAVLVLRPRAEEWSEAVDTALGQPVPSLDQRRWLIRRIAQRLSPDLARRVVRQGGQAEFLSDPPTGPMEPPTGPSPLARRLLTVADLEHEARRRRANAQALGQLFAKRTSLRTLFQDGDYIPYRLALRAISPKAAATAYRALRRAGLPVESWPDLPPEVTADPAHGPGAVALRQSVLLLPVHGALSPDALAKAYGKVLR
jgi:dTDP-4-amino-4,6-dideoxygalactose transaminase